VDENETISVRLISTLRYEKSGIDHEKEHSVAGRQGAERELMRDNEYNSETNKQTKKNRFEECHIGPGVKPEKGHLAPEVKMANEIVCDHVWDKLYLPFL
jgi:hypothetical protein